MTRRQLLDLGFAPRSIEHRLSRGHLHAVWRGVYAVGWPGLTQEQRWMAAVLACGDGAVLSHGSAAVLWRIARGRGGAVEISVRRRDKPRRGGIRTWARPSLPDSDILHVNGIPVTQPIRTLVDLATELAPSALERAVNEADKRDLVDPDALRETLNEFVGEPGVLPLRKLLDRDTFRLSDSDLERLFRPLTAGAGLPEPETKAWVSGFEVDFFWPDLGLVIETDGLRYHRTPATQARDRLRDQTHTATGLTTLRFTHHQVKFERARVRNVLRRTVQRLPSRPKRHS